MTTANGYFLVSGFPGLDSVVYYKQGGASSTNTETPTTITGYTTSTLTRNSPITGLTANTQYTFRAVLKTKTNTTIPTALTSPFSTSVTITTAPNVPGTTTIVSTTDKVINLAWAQATGGAA
jgi:hypothetical protein